MRPAGGIVLAAVLGAVMLGGLVKCGMNFAERARAEREGQAYRGASTIDQGRYWTDHIAVQREILAELQALRAELAAMRGGGE